MGDAIEYRSYNCNVTSDTDVMDTIYQNGMKCVCHGRINTYYYIGIENFRIDFIWEFDWSELKSEGVDEITGYIIVTSRNDWFPQEKIDVKLTVNYQVFTTQVRGANLYNDISYQYSLIPHYAPVLEKPDYDKMFAPSDQNDTILVVDKKKLHVNKTFLSYHSEYFRALFSSNFKEGQMDEIPIRDVSYEDFALLLSTFHPNPVFPNDRNVEKLLELGRRFLLPSAISSAEHHLVYNSKFGSQKMLYLADEYGMPRLLERSFRGLNTLEKVKQINQSEEFEKLSDETKVKIIERNFKMFHI